jgi:hypothetical protein
MTKILTCIKKLKNNKGSGDDMIRNEFIKSTSNMFLALYVDLFNLILFKHGMKFETESL